MSATQREVSTPPAPPLIDRDALGASPPVRRLPGRNFSKADVSVYLKDGIEIAVKDYGERAWPVRQTLGRWLIRREVAAYRAADGLEGLASFLGRVGPFALATRWIAGRALDDCRPGELAPELFVRLARLVAALHERGIALGDLHHRDVIVGDDGGVHVVDLATAWVLGPRPGMLRRKVFERLRDGDRVALARITARYTGGDLTAAVEAVGPRAAAWHRRGRRLKALWNYLRGPRRGDARRDSRR